MAKMASPMVALSPRTTLEGKSYLTETLLWFHTRVPVCTGTWNDGTPGRLSSVRAIGTPAPLGAALIINATTVNTVPQEDG